MQSIETLNVLVTSRWCDCYGHCRLLKACAASRVASSDRPLGKPIRGMIIFLPTVRSRLCQVLEGSGWGRREGGRTGQECSVMWHSRVWQCSPVDGGPKAPLGKQALCEVWKDGRGSERLTFQQGLWPLEWPIIWWEIGEHLQCQRPELTVGRISPFFTAGLLGNVKCFTLLRRRRRGRNVSLTKESSLHSMGDGNADKQREKKPQ